MAPMADDAQKRGAATPEPGADRAANEPRKPAAENGEQEQAQTTPPLAEALIKSGAFEEDVTVEVAYEVIQLLSAQLYSSPLKAIEELVVNSWDADATECHVFVPDPSVLAERDPTTAIAVLDNGHGMTVDDLRSLWHVGMSAKRDAGWEHRAKRKQIGKFGIGKLASYAIARRVTYLTKSVGEPPRGVTIDFEDFRTSPSKQGETEPVTLKMLRVDDRTALLEDDRLKRVLEGLKVDAQRLGDDGWDSWTLVVLENLKEKSSDVKPVGCAGC